jgi:hypothetical protein
MRNMAKYAAGLVLLDLFIIGICFCQIDSAKQEYVNLTLTLADGFDVGEHVIIHITTSKGIIKTIYDSTLSRSGINSVNFFTIRLERGKANTVCVNCPSRKVKCCHSFLFREKTYLEVNIDENNQFYLLSSDRGLLYE